MKAGSFLAGVVLGIVLLMLAVCVLELEVQLSLANARVAVLESRVHEMDTLRRELDELQSWRVRVTLASRMGWSQAHRFIREFPLEEEGGQ